MRVCYDTNQLVQILASKGKSLQFRRLLTIDGVTHVTSEHVLKESEAILVSKFGRTRQFARSKARLLSKLSDVVKPARVEPVSRDPDDDQVLAGAVAGRADYLVTADDDLLVIKEHCGVRIVSPAEFEGIIRKRAA